jgi:hypothetical protein
VFSSTHEKGAEAVSALADGHQRTKTFLDARRAAQPWYLQWFMLAWLLGSLTLPVGWRWLAITCPVLMYPVQLVILAVFGLLLGVLLLSLALWFLG